MGHYYCEEKGVLPHRILTKTDDDDDDDESNLIDID